MSVAFGSPLSGRKRLFEDSAPGCGGQEDRSRLSAGPGGLGGYFKRARHLQAAAPLPCRPEEALLGPRAGGWHARHGAALRLGGMFPDVDEKVRRALAAAVGRFGPGFGFGWGASGWNFWHLLVLCFGVWDREAKGPGGGPGDRACLWRL